MQGQIVLNKYRVGRLIGRGSMGEVYAATPVAGGRDVVVKFMGPKVAGQPRFREMFGREMELMARFRHPHAVRLLSGSLDDPAGPCLVMEYVPGVELSQLLRLEKRLDAERLGGLVLPLCQALHAAHTAGIVHRDLKPANLMILDPGTPRESAKVMDLGLASLTFKPHIPVEKLMGAGEVRAVGSPSYMFPEQIRGDDTDARGDIYSLGVVLFEALTGQLPFEDQDISALLQAHVSRRPPSFAQVGADGVPPPVESLILRCMEKYPNERPQSAYEVAKGYLRAIGVDTPLDPSGFLPVGDTGTSSQSHIPLSSNSDRVVQTLEAWMPESIAVVKLRGFLEDLGARLVESEPGLIRVHIGEPPPAKEPPKGIWKLFHRPPSPPPPGNPPPVEPVAIELHLNKRPGAKHLDISAAFRALEGPLPSDPRWHKRTKKLAADLKAYLMAQR